jgi:DNA-binding SARP family transcriptional activator
MDLPQLAEAGGSSTRAMRTEDLAISGQPTRLADVRGIRFRVLGPVEMETDDGQVSTIRRRQVRCVLAILVLESERWVSLDRLCDLIWDDEPPPHAPATMRTHIARIRKLVARTNIDPSDGPVLAHQRGRYMMRVRPDAVDAHRFRSLVHQAACAPLADRAQLLQAALTLWRGPALYRAADERLRARLCADLTELRINAVEDSFATRLALGEQRAVLPELARLIAELPTREPLVRLYIRVLYNMGRTADALNAYARLRAHLAEHLGLAPSPDTERLYLTILRHEPLAAPVGLAG